MSSTIAEFSYSYTEAAMNGNPLQGDNVNTPCPWNNIIAPGITFLSGDKANHQGNNVNRRGKKATGWFKKKLYTWHFFNFSGNNHAGRLVHISF